MNAIPIDLVLDIFSRLPAKSVARSRCVSKLWSSMLRRPDFTELFLTRSSARPHHLLAVEKEGVLLFFSFLQPQNPFEKSSSLVISADFQTKFPGDNMSICCSSYRRFSCGYASGLVYFSGMWFSDKDTVPVICNPNTGQFSSLPKLLRYIKSYSFLGFDPIGKQFKVLLMAYPYGGDKGDHRILTLGNGKMKWRKIKCSLDHEPLSDGFCINGVLYYIGEKLDVTTVIVCFDVGSEIFKFIDINEECLRFCDWHSELINYKGEVCVIYWKYDSNAIEFWVLKNVVEEEREWSNYVYTLAEDNTVDIQYVSVLGVFDLRYVNVVGVTATGEIVLSRDYYTSEPFYVFYFNPERNTFQCVEIKGFSGECNEESENQSVYMFIDHVEDLNLNDAKLLNSSIFKKNKSRFDVDSVSREKTVGKKKKKPRREER